MGFYEKNQCPKTVAFFYEMVKNLRELSGVAIISASDPNSITVEFDM